MKRRRISLMDGFTNAFSELSLLVERLPENKLEPSFCFEPAQRCEQRKSCAAEVIMMKFVLRILPHPPHPKRFTNPVCLNPGYDHGRRSFVFYLTIQNGSSSK